MVSKSKYMSATIEKHNYSTTYLYHTTAQICRLKIGIEPPTVTITEAVLLSNSVKFDAKNVTAE